MVFDSPIDHFRHYGIFTGVSRHSHSGVGGAWACLVPTIGVLHVRGFPAPITKSSFVSPRVVAAAFFDTKSRPLTRPTFLNNAHEWRESPISFRLAFFDAYFRLVHYWLLFVVLSTFFTFLTYAATRTHGLAVVSHEALFSSRHNVVAHASGQRLRHGI
jgi:hypothetical protein